MKIAQCLIEHGADTKAEDNEGKTPLDIALKKGNQLESLLKSTHDSLHKKLRLRFFEFKLLLFESHDSQLH